MKIKTLTAALMLCAGTAMAAKLPSPGEAAAVRSALGGFKAEAESFDGPVHWEGRAISVIGLAEVGKDRWHKAYATTRPLKVIRVFGRSPEGRLARFDYAAYRANPVAQQDWRLVEWHEMSLREAEESVTADLGAEVSKRHFGSLLFGGPQR